MTPVELLERARLQKRPEPVPGRPWASTAALAFPWFVGAAIAALIAVDWRGGGSVTWLDANEMARTSVIETTQSVVAIDPVCGMTVRSARSDKAVHDGRLFHFCSSYCREEFGREPGRFSSAALAPRETHSMRGIPTRMYQWGLAVLLLLSFGLVELLVRGKPGAAGPMSARLDLTAWPRLRRLLASPLFPFIPRVVLAAVFLIIIAAGLFGNQNPRMNLAPLLTWTVWWTGLVFAVLYLGKAWCTVCPWDALAGWTVRFGGPSLGLPWPKALRNIWPAVGLFLLLTWVELGMGVTMIPRATAWVALGMLGLATASAFVFERKAFCRYGCLVGRVSGLYAMFSTLEARAGDAEACASCRTLDCYRGNARGGGCPTFEFPRAMTLNTYCTLCSECFKSCPSSSMSLRLRPWAADLAAEGRPRSDEAALSLILLSMTAFHGLTMTPTWTLLLDAARAATGLSFLAAFTAVMAVSLALPAAVYAGLAWFSSAWAGLDFRAVFLRFAYALLPIALFYHLAHNAEHFLLEGPKVLALASDPFGWGWDLFRTARWQVPPLVSLEGLWRIQVLLVLAGHVYSLWLTARAARRLAPEGRGAVVVQLPMLAAMVAFSWVSLWLLKQPMEMRVSAM